MKFKYTKLSSGVVRPIIPITVKSNNTHVDYYALVDSGTDICLLPGGLGEFLGMDLTQKANQELSI